MEGYADPSTAAQDAMVNTVRCELLKHKKEQIQMLKSDLELTYIFFPFPGILDSMGSMSAENRRTQKHAANDSLQQELPAVVDG